MPLREQAVLFRTAHHSGRLEIELTNRNIPFVKYGGLKFLEAAHVKDVLAVLRWADNPRDRIAGFRVLAAHARRRARHGRAAARRDGRRRPIRRGLDSFRAAGAGRRGMAGVRRSYAAAADEAAAWPADLELVAHWYEPQLERIHEDARSAQADLEQLEQIAAGYASRASAS